MTILKTKVQMDALTDRISSASEFAWSGENTFTVPMQKKNIYVYFVNKNPYKWQYIFQNVVWRFHTKTQNTTCGFVNKKIMYQNWINGRYGAMAGMGNVRLFMVAE